MFDVVPTQPGPNDPTVAQPTPTAPAQPGATPAPADPGASPVPASTDPQNVQPGATPAPAQPMTPQQPAQPTPAPAATPAPAQPVQPGATPQPAPAPSPAPAPAAAPQAPADPQAPTAPAQPAQAPTMEERVAGIEFRDELAALAPHLAGDTTAIWDIKKSFPGMTTQQAIAQHLGNTMVASAASAQVQGITHQPVAPAMPTGTPDMTQWSDAELTAQARQDLHDRGFV